MTKQTLFLAVIFNICAFPQLSYGAAQSIDLSTISNQNGYTQKTHSATYTVGADGQTLMYRNKDTGMRLDNAATPGSQIRVTDNNIAARASTGATAGQAAATQTPTSNPTTPTSNPTTPTPNPTASTPSAPSTPANNPPSPPPATGATTPAPAQNSATTTGAAKGWKGMSKTQKTLGVLGAVGGGAMIYDATSGQDKHSIVDLAEGAGGGAMAGAAIGSMVPVIGTGIGAAGGAIIGGVISGSQLFSETDCLDDPVTGQFTCCNTVFTSGQRNAKIGEYMFCGIDGQALPPGVRQCQQGGKDTATSWWDGLWQDDAWEKECQPRWCQNVIAPVSGTLETSIKWMADTENMCWDWDCLDGYNKINNTCVSVNADSATNNATGTATVTDNTNTQQNQYDALIQHLESIRQKMQQECTGQI